MMEFKLFKNSLINIQNLKMYFHSATLSFTALFFAKLTKVIFLEYVVPPYDALGMNFFAKNAQEDFIFFNT